MTDPIPFPASSGVERKQLAEGAAWLIENKTLARAILDLRKRWFAEMMASTDEAQDRLLKARIQALEAIPQELQILINNERMAQDRKR